MPGIRALRKLQFGREATAGTAVAATTVWRGMGTIEDDREVVFPAEDIGYLSGTDRSYIPKISALLELESTVATFEQLPHVLEMGVMTATPTADGIGTGKIYTYNFPTTSVPTIKTYTIEGGDNQQAEEMEYSFCESFELSGNAGEAWMLTASLRGRQATNTTFTPALAIPSVDDMLFQKTKLYVDAIGGTLGTTQISNTLLSATLSVTTGLIAVWTADGNLYFSFAKNTMPEVKLAVTFEHDTNSVAEKTNYRNQTARLIQLKTEGAALTTPGTAYSFKTKKINLAGKWSNFDKIGEQDGNDIIEAEFTARYNSTAAQFAQIIVVNELASLP